MKKKILWINFIYIVIFLVIVIIYLITVKVGVNDDIVKYLGLGLTITSLFVGLIAIFQALFSGNSLDRTIRVLDRSTRNMEQTSADVKSIIQSLHLKVEEIPKQIGDLSDKLSKGLIKSEIGVVNQSGTSPSVTKDFVINFLENSSTNGIMSIYIATKSNDLGKPVNINDLFQDVTIINSSYVFGYIVAARSFGVFKATYVGEKVLVSDSVISMSDVYPILTKKIEAHNNDGYVTSFNSVLKKIESYFKD